MLSYRNGGCELLLCQERAQRQPCCDWFCNGYYVRHYTEGLKREHTSGTAQPALDFVENQSRVMPIRHSPAFFQEFARALMDATFAENRFQYDGASVVVDRSPQSFRVISRDELHVFEQRLKSFSILLLTRQ